MPDSVTMLKCAEFFNHWNPKHCRLYIAYNNVLIFSCFFPPVSWLPNITPLSYSVQEFTQLIYYSVVFFLLLFGCWEIVGGRKERMFWIMMLSHNSEKSMAKPCLILLGGLISIIETWKNISHDNVFSIFFPSSPSFSWLPNRAPLSYLFN